MGGLIQIWSTLEGNYFTCKLYWIIKTKVFDWISVWCKSQNALFAVLQYLPSDNILEGIWEVGLFERGLIQNLMIKKKLNRIITVHMTWFLLKIHANVH